MQFAAAIHRETVKIGPFTATFTPSTDLPYLNYAVPDEGATASAEDIANLVEAYQARGRIPRLEYISAAAPAIEGQLIGSGFVIEGRLPLMVCSPSTFRPPEPPEGIDVLSANTDADFEGAVAVTKQAYSGDDSPPTAPEVAARRRLVALGGIVVLARDQQSSEACGSGICEVPHDAISEVATVGVVPSYRRRGVAAAVTGGLCQEALKAGVESLWLTPERDYTERLYARLGFETVSEVIHLSQ